MSSFGSLFSLGRLGLLTTLIALMLVVGLVGPATGLALADAPDLEPVDPDADLETDAMVEVDDDLEELLEDAEANGLETVELIVRFEPPDVADVPEDDVEDALEEHAEETQADIHEYGNGDTDIEVTEEFWLANAILLEVDPETVDLEALAAADDVVGFHENFEIDSPEPDVERETLEASVFEEAAEAESEEQPADRNRGYTTTYGVTAVNAPAVWEVYETQGEGVTAAVLDTGIDADHPDLDLYTEDPDDPTYPGGWAEFSEDGSQVDGSVPSDAGTHGTHVSGTVAGGNEIGVHVGVAPDVRLLHGQVLGEESGTFAQMVAGMQWAVEADADVVSMSFGAIGTYDSLIRPIRHIEHSGAVPIAATGNDGADVSGSPANVYDAFAVGAVDANSEVAEFSGGGEIKRDDWQAPPTHWPESYLVPDVTAPGVSIGSTVPGGYGYSSGTSMATPHVSGAAALMLAVDDGLTPAEITEAFEETATKPTDVPTEKDDRYGYGTIDTLSALEFADVAAEPSELEGTADDGADDGLAGFGVGVAFVAVLVTLCVVVGRTNR